MYQPQPVMKNQIPSHMMNHQFQPATYSGYPAYSPIQHKLNVPVVSCLTFRELQNITRFEQEESDDDIIFDTPKNLTIHFNKTLKGKFLANKALYPSVPILHNQKHQPHYGFVVKGK